MGPSLTREGGNFSKGRKAMSKVQAFKKIALHMEATSRSAAACMSFDAIAKISRNSYGKMNLFESKGNGKTRKLLSGKVHGFL